MAKTSEWSLSLNKMTDGKLNKLKDAFQVLKEWDLFEQEYDPILLRTLICHTMASRKKRID